jgi:hypothetical protein
LPKGAACDAGDCAGRAIAVRRAAPQKTDWIGFQLIIVLEELLDEMSISDLIDSSSRRFVTVSFLPAMPSLLLLN